MARRRAPRARARPCRARRPLRPAVALLVGLRGTRSRTSRSSTCRSCCCCACSRASAGRGAAVVVGCFVVAVALALVFARIGFAEYATRAAPLEPEGDRGERVRVVLPGQLALLRPEHLRPLPGDRDDRPGRHAALGRGAAREIASVSLMLAVLWGAHGALVLAVELRRAPHRPGGARRAALGLAPGRPRRRGGRGGRASRWCSLAPGLFKIDLEPSRSLDRATSGRVELMGGGIAMFADRPRLRLRLGLVRRAVPRARGGELARGGRRLRTRCRSRSRRSRAIVGLAAYVCGARCGVRAPLPRPRAVARTRPAAAARLARLRGGGVHGPRAPHAALRRVPRGPDHLDAAGGRDRACAPGAAQRRCSRRLFRCRWRPFRFFCRCAAFFFACFSLSRELRALRTKAEQSPVGSQVDPPPVGDHRAERAVPEAPDALAVAHVEALACSACRGSRSRRCCRARSARRRSCRWRGGASASLPDLASSA